MDNQMIYDGHAYCFPTQEIASEGFADPAEYWRWLQLFMTFARQQPSWRCQDRHAAGMADMSKPWDLMPCRRPASAPAITA